MSINQTINTLKDNQEDFEFYPTTKEILEVLEMDIKKEIKELNKDYRRRDEALYFDKDNQSYKINKFLDIGCGSGKVSQNLNISIWDNYGIEKSDLLADSLIKKGFNIIGRDFYEVSLIDKYFDIVYTNPPYSDFKNWVKKTVSEVNAQFLYFLIPQRWEQDNELKKLFEKKGEIVKIDSFDFFESEDRKARAKVDLLKIRIKKGCDAFSDWITENLGEFKKDEEIIKEEKEQEENLKNQLEERDKDKVKILCENYNKDLDKLLYNFQQIGKIDFSILEQLGLKKYDIQNKIKADIKDLKMKYWGLTFNILEEITKKLTYESRRKILNEINIFKELDFNKSNIRTVIIWVIENFNKYVKTQLIKAYDEITETDYLKAYKSNIHFEKDTWRYINKPLKYSLEYRIITRYRGSQYGYEKTHANIINDLIVVANNLGFECDKTLRETDLCTGNKYTIYMNNNKQLFEYKIFQNGNVHLKFDIEFMKVFNIEAGKEKGWIKAPQDIMEEFNLDLEECVRFFTNPNLKLLSDESGVKLLGV